MEGLAMTDQTNPRGGSTDPIPGDPLTTDRGTSDPVEAPAVYPPVAEPVTPSFDLRPVESAPSDEAGGGKVKAAAVVAGAAAVANKVRKEVPKVVNQLRERRMAGRCVIITEVDGRYLAIGPYKNEDAAQGDVFKVGGTPHVAELVSDTAFFAPPEQP
jgi:hypothetical protein